QQVIARAADHHLPPPTVIFTGALVLLQVALVAVAWIATLGGADPEGLFPEAELVLPSDDGMLGATALAVSLLLLQIGVLRRSRWARIALMALFTGYAVAALAVATSTPGDAAHSLLVGAGASALGVMAISSDASRQWVQTLRLDLRSAEAEADAEPSADGAEGHGTEHRAALRAQSPEGRVPAPSHGSPRRDRSPLPPSRPRPLPWEDPMSESPDTAPAHPAGPEASGDDQPALKKAITPKLLLLFIVGDILGTGVYSLTGKVAGEVGGAGWIPIIVAFAVAMVS